MEDRRIRNLNGYLREIFGQKVHKVGLWGGFSCPNRDGKLSIHGCSFCNPASSRPASWSRGKSVPDQLMEGCRYISERYGVSAFLPYFQDYTTTYGDPGELRRMYESVLDHPGVVGISLCTRPDCLSEPVLDLLEELSGRTFLWVEVGVQTSDDELLRDMNRCHLARDSREAFERLHERGILTAAHMILGYPGMDGSTVRKDADFVRECGAAGLKLHGLHVVRDTPLAISWERGEIHLPTVESYTHMVVEFLELTDPGTVIMRLTGEAPKHLTLAPDWSLDKMSVLRSIHDAMESSDTWQGKGLGFDRRRLHCSPLSEVSSERNYCSSDSQ